MSLNILKAKISRNLSALHGNIQNFISQRRNKNLRDIQAIKFLVLILIVMIILSFLIDGLFDISRNFFGDQTLNSSFPTWDVDIPENYSIRDEGSFSTDYYGVFYEEWSGNYQVNIYQGKGYSLSQIKSYINNQLLQFEDFKDYEYFEKHEIIFNDRRSENLPTMEIPSQPND